MKAITFFYILLLFASKAIYSSCSATRRDFKDSAYIVSHKISPVVEFKKHMYLPIKPYITYELNTNWDLKGETYIIPEGVTLKSNGGHFLNGTLIGNNTKIDAKNTLFSKVEIKGKWNVPHICTSLFTTLDYENSLRDVFALSHANVKNKIIIDKGDYYVSSKSFQSAISVVSNTDLVIDGNIHLIPNSHKGCYILQIKDASNVSILGKGCLYGDKNTHKGKDGEWGHGIYVDGSRDVKIQELKVNDCWGDCIYVGGTSKNIIIKKCRLNNGRRQGISVTSADGVTIEDCVITNVSGTDPQAAIDIEPNHNDTVDNIYIRNILCKNCYGGIETWKPEDAFIGKVVIKRCIIENSMKRWPLALRHTRNARVENCIIDSDNRTAIMAANVESVVIKDNSIISSSNTPISVSKCDKRDVRNNTISLR